MADSDQCFIGGEGKSYAYDPIVRFKTKPAAPIIPAPVIVGPAPDIPPLKSVPKEPSVEVKMEEKQRTL